MYKDVSVVITSAMKSITLCNQPNPPDAVSYHKFSVRIEMYIHIQSQVLLRSQQNAEFLFLLVTYLTDRDSFTLF
jgi:hypothetical protein